MRLLQAPAPLLASGLDLSGRLRRVLRAKSGRTSRALGCKTGLFFFFPSTAERQRCVFFKRKLGEWKEKSSWREESARTHLRPSQKETRSRSRWRICCVWASEPRTDGNGLRCLIERRLWIDATDCMLSITSTLVASRPSCERLHHSLNNNLRWPGSPTNECELVCARVCVNFRFAVQILALNRGHSGRRAPAFGIGECGPALVGICCPE